jgi:CDP-6-deoxy-D-xylo-4-hexulose-3-dehydrase
MKYKIPLVKESFYKEKATKAKLIKFIRSSEKFSMGDQTKRFETDFSKFQNTEYCVLFSSGSAANLALIQSILNLGKINKGDSVAVSALTWATNVMPLMQLGLKPVPIDVDLSTLNISIEDLERKFQQYKFKAIFLTNVLSFSCDMQNLRNFCKLNSILLLEDNCESLGSEYKEEKLGNFGLAGTFSFFIGHQMSMIEGGCVVTNDFELYEMLKITRAHGWARDKEGFNNSDFYSRFTFYDLAYNLRPGEINAFIGNLQLQLLNENLLKRFNNFNRFYKKIKSKKSIYKLDIQNNFYAPFAFTLVFKEKALCDKFIKIFEENVIEIRPIISGNIAKQPFFKKYINETFDLPNSDLVHNQGFYFGVNPSFKKKEIETIYEILSKIQ